MDLTDEQCKVLEPWIPEPPGRADGRGRPWWDAREALDGILGILHTGAPGTTCPIAILPTRPAIGAFSDGSRRACSRGPRSLGRGPKGAWGLGPLGVLRRRHLRGGQKGGPSVGETKRGKGMKLMAVTDGSGVPISVHAASASPHEVTLVAETIEACFAPGKPEQLIGDWAYDSDPLGAEPREAGVEIIAPHRKNRKKPKT